MQLHHAVPGLGDLEAERLQGEIGGEPDVAAAVRGDAGPEGLRVRLAGEAVDAVGGDDQVVRGGQRVRVRCLGAEAEVHAEVAAAVVEDPQEASAAEGGEAVAAGGVPCAAVDDVDVVPADELPPHRLVHHRVGVLDAAEGLVGEDDTETERVVGGRCVPRR
ncbi:hypothetical protein GCM10020256_15190 [Streptomyces thermocoprophilus]